MELFDLGKDAAEKNDLAKASPEKVVELTRLHDAWLADMANPIRAGTKKAVAGTEPAAKRKKNPDRKKKIPIVIPIVALACLLSVPAAGQCQ